MGLCHSRSSGQVPTISTKNPIDLLLWEKVKNGRLDELDSFAKGKGDFECHNEGWTLLAMAVIEGLNWDMETYLKMIRKLVLLGANPLTKMTFETIIHINIEDVITVESAGPNTTKQRGYRFKVRDLDMFELLAKLRLTFKKPILHLTFCERTHHDLVDSMLLEATKLLQGETSDEIGRVFSNREKRFTQMLTERYHPSTAVPPAPSAPSAPPAPPASPRDEAYKTQY